MFDTGIITQIIQLWKKKLFSNLCCVIPKYICDKNMYVIVYYNMQIYSKNDWNDF
jgi:hypothetical protein